MGSELQLANQILIGKVIEDGTSAQSSFRTCKGDLWDHLAFRAVILLEHWQWSFQIILFAINSVALR